MLEILLTLGIPLICGLVLTLLRAVAWQKECTWGSSQDVALDMTFLAMGAAGSVFHNAAVQMLFRGAYLGIFGGLLLSDLVVASILIYCIRFIPVSTARGAYWTLSLGAVPLMFVAVVTYLGTSR